MTASGDPAPGDEPRVRLRWGGTSDVGQLREVNEDSMLLGPGVFVVADGMGGHAAGDVASRMAVDAIDAELPDAQAGSTTRVVDIVGAVQSANEVVHEHSESQPGLSGMGTTVVAIALVVEEGEHRLAVVNVGDSRAYRLSRGELEQVSDDHSLVGELVRDGRISPEEARVHPQKNIVTRAVGIEEYVEVDEFQLLPRTGDRYLLCSDGLTDEVDETDIASVLRTVDDPDEAAAELVRRANEHGGRDNVTVVIVDVVDSGIDETAAAAQAAVPDDDDFSHDPDQDTQSLLAVPDDQAHRQRGSGAGGHPPGEADLAGGVTGGGGPEGTAGTGRRPRSQRAVTVRSLAFVLVVLLVLGGGGFLVYNAVRNTYFVGIEDGEVAIYRGRPGGVLWFDPALVDVVGIDVDEVPEDALDDLEEGVRQPTLTRARRYVTNLEERIEELTPPVTTTTSTTSTSTTSTTSTSTTSTEP